MNKFMTSILAGAALTAGAWAEEAQPVAEETPVLTEQTSEDVFANWGTFSGQLHALGIQNDFTGEANKWPYGSEASVSGSATLRFVSNDFAGFVFGAEYIHGGNFFSGGGHLEDTFIEDGRGANWNANGQVNVLNQFYLKYNLGALKLEQTDLTVGRQVLQSTDGYWNGLAFLPIKHIRHKDQAVEAITLRSQDIEDFHFVTGVVSKFSNWGWTDYEGDMFDDVEDAFLRSLGQGINGISLEGEVDSDGMYFFEGTYSGIDKLKLTGFDYYTDNIMNTAGAKVQYQISDNWRMMSQYMYQTVLGDTEDYFSNNTPGGYTDAEAEMFEFSITRTIDTLNFELGYLTVFGENDGDTYKSFTLPFDNSFGIGDQLLVNTNAFAAGAQNYYAKVYGTLNKTFFVLTYTYTDHKNGTVAYDAQEIDLIVDHPITDNLSAQFLTSYAVREGKSNDENGYANDVRLGLLYKF